MNATDITRTVTPTAIREAQTPSGGGARIDALDWTKGALILFMVVYHAVNYSAFRPLAFKYLAFLPSSFILITGFLVGQVYATKYDLGTRKPYMRLTVRGMKLIALFAFLNLGNLILTEHSVYDGLGEFGERARTMFISGNGRTGIFEVLLPIGYFLMLAPVLLWLRARNRAWIGLLALGVFALCSWLEFRGQASKNLALLSAGIIGTALGLIEIGRINRLACDWIPSLALYSLYRLGSYLSGETYPVQFFGAVTSVFLLFSCARHLVGATALGKRMAEFGKYSLLGYLAQIALLRSVVHIAGGKPSHWTGVGIVAVVTTLLLFLTVRAVDSSRKRSRILERVYRGVFA